MHSRMVSLFFCFVLALRAWAGDPWKEKTYKEWDEKDVNRILVDSPWARPITVLATWRSGGKSLPDSAARHTGGAGAAGERSGGIGTDVTNAINAEVGGVRAANSQEARFILRWGSARTTREALARFSVLHGTSEADAEKAMNLPVTQHQIVLFGPEMEAFAKSDEKSLMEKTFLTLKKNKLRISPLQVEIKRGQDAKKIAGIVFYFAMKSETGEPVIAPDEKSVEFECLADRVSFRQSFDPQKMVSKAGPEFR